MPLVNLLFELDDQVVANLPSTTVKLADGRDLMVVDATVRGDLMALVLTWMTFNKDHVSDDEHGMAAGGDVRTLGMDNSKCNEYFICLIREQGVPFLVELSEVAVRLELWPLFEQCSKELANMIWHLNSDHVKQLFGIDSDGKRSKLSAPCIKGFLKYLSIEKRLELDTIELKEWQHASYSLWSEQKVLRFGNGHNHVIFDCKHAVDEEENVLNLVICTQRELDQNWTSIKATAERTCPERFLDIVRKCTNLETIIWDEDFGELADPELANVLKLSCPQLEHVQGLVRRKFKVNQEQICPASFISVFKRDKNLTCYQVNYDEVNEKKRQVAEDRKTAEQLRVEFEKADLKRNEDIKALTVKPTTGNWLQRMVQERSRTKELNEYLKANVRKCAPFEQSDVGQMMYLVSISWYNKLIDCIAFGLGTPGVVKNKSLIRGDSINRLLLKPGLKINVQFVALTKHSWDILEATCGSDHVISRPVVSNGHGTFGLGLNYLYNEFHDVNGLSILKHSGYCAAETTFNEMLGELQTSRPSILGTGGFSCSGFGDLGKRLKDEGVADGDTLYWRMKLNP